MCLVKLVFSFSWDKHAEAELLGCMIAVFSFSVEPPYSSTVAAPICSPTNSARSFFFLHIHANTCLLLYLIFFPVNERETLLRSQRTGFRQEAALWAEEVVEGPYLTFFLGHRLLVWLGWTSSYKAKGCWFDSQSGFLPGLRVLCPIEHL